MRQRKRLDEHTSSVSYCGIRDKNTVRHSDNATVALPRYSSVYI